MGKLRIIICLLSLLGALVPTLVAPQPVMAGEVVYIYSSEDTYIDQYYDTTNYGSAQLMYIGRQWVSPDRANRGLMEYPINWGTTIPSDAVITTATLYLRYSGHGSEDPVGRTIRVQRMLRYTWSENQATWEIYRSG